MGISHDRISNLPDEILEAILCLIPLKSAISTSILSRRWRGLWKFSFISATSLDLGEDFACSQSPKDLVDTVTRYLHLHGDQELENLRILFSPYDRFLSDIENWIRIAARKGVKQLELDLSQGIISSVNGFYMDGRQLYAMPECFNDCKSLTHLSLSRCDLSDFSSFASFGGLQVLCLTHVDFSDEMLQTLLKDCPVLENLSLRNCRRLSIIRIAGPELRLRVLTLVDCLGAYELEISAPKLQTFHYYGHICSENIFTDNSELNDAYVSIVDDDDLDSDFLEFISQISHVKILTLCSTSLMHAVASEDFDPGITMDNLLELQLLMKSMTEEHLACIYFFFSTCSSPYLQKLFIQLPHDIDEAIDIRSLINSTNNPPEDVSFLHLKFIKITNFRGSHTELKLVKFLLEKTVELESLVLVAPRVSDKDSTPILQNQSAERISTKIIMGQLSMLPKASPEARINYCNFGEDNCSMKPTHTNFYSEYQYLSGNLSHHMDQAAAREEILFLN